MDKLHVYIHMCVEYALPQCKVCEEGMALHAQVGPESMKELHHRMEELLADYRYTVLIVLRYILVHCRARYGGGTEDSAYDPVTFGEPRGRLLSSTGGRRDKFRKSKSSLVLYI